MREVLADLKAAGATWVQFDEPKLVLDLDFHQLKAFTNAYLQMEESLSGLKVIVETYFFDVSVGPYKTITSLKGILAIGFNLVRGEKTLELNKSLGFPSSKYVFARVVDGHNIWANDLITSLKTLKALES
ncbi:5-methyltetrahydropteroyltriglutamate--homocysteine methyltransferase 2-like [Magnolia sinica]|uniref:5-methyltetrahydropteroyltriglutamate-- homocysteine methyltransferase 2-like n=1 Tax=Magnolia sinica TaxID=86752 RepID=UPI002658E417|nr:5-methyltetrahydropteroyltriglutamate--homocysteine methyltransferase 2-like [Magnolia sinica]